MNSFQGISTGLAVAAMSRPTRLRVFSQEFANQLLAFGDEYADIGQLWLDGAAFEGRGKKLSGCFAGRAQNKQARVLIFKGRRMQRRAENAFANFVAQGEAKVAISNTKQEIQNV